MATRNGSAEWQGDLKTGSGRLTVGDGVFEGNYSFASRFEEGQGTNPEELLAGAEAACYAMALSNILATNGHKPEDVRAGTRVHLRNIDGEPTIARIDIDVEARVPGLEEEEFLRYAEEARAGCPVSRALAGVPEIAETARLVP
jgi:osmotically inducible protein OsmC